MRRLTLGAITLVSLGVMAVGGAAAHSTSEKTVRTVCGKDLQSNGSTIGCHKGNIDYHCHQGKCQAHILRTQGTSSPQVGPTGTSQKLSAPKPSAVGTPSTRAIQQQGTFQRR
jgi:hypothetical protein